MEVIRMNRQRWAASVFAALVLPASAQTGGGVAGTANPPKTSTDATDNQESLRGAMLVSFLHQANLREIDMARLVKTKFDSPQISRFADELLADHQAMDDQLVTFAKDRGIDLEAVRARVQADIEQQWEERRTKAVGSATGEWAFTAEPRVDPEVARLAMTKFRASQDKLRTLTGVALSREFVQAVIDDHQMVIDRTSRALARINDPEVKGLVGKLLPVFKRHLTEAQGLQDRLSKS
jgi:predicted outer membrane protein